MLKKKNDLNGKIINHQIELTKGDQMYFKTKSKDNKYLDINSDKLFNPDIQEIFINGEKVI